MEYFNYLIFIAALSILNGGILFLIKIFDYLKINPKQKIIFIKTAFSMLVVSPLILMVVHYYSFQSIQLTLPVKFTTPTTNIVPSTLVNTYIDWSYYIIVAYGICLAFMLLRILISYYKAKLLFKNASSVIIQGQSILLSTAISSPLSFGLPAAKIYFPATVMQQWTEREIEISLAHERCHVKNYDPHWKLVSLLIRAALFFAPWSYILHNRFELEMEVYCDEETRLATQSSISEYGELLLAMACTYSRSLLFTNLSNSTLKRRFIAMKSISIKRPIFTTFLSAIFLLFGTVTLALASGLKTENTIFYVSTKFYEDGELIASPQLIAKSAHKATVVMADHMEKVNDKFNMKGNVLKIELIAANDKITDAIKLDFNVQYQNAKENMHSKPSITVLPKQPGSISFNSEGHEYQIQVVADRK